MKKCTKCKLEKEFGDFHKNKNSKDGRASKCKVCCSEYYQENRDEPLSKSLERRFRIRDQHLIYMKQLYRRTKDKHNAMSRERRKHTRERDREYFRKYYSENKEKFYQYNSNRKEKNHSITIKEWVACKNYFGNSCAYCGMSYDDHKRKYKQDLHKEHVVHDGRNDLKNCVPSCRNCNSQKWEHSLNYWYKTLSTNYSYDRYYKIYQWMRYDCHNYIEKKLEKRKEK